MGEREALGDGRLLRHGRVHVQRRVGQRRRERPGQVRGRGGRRLGGHVEEQREGGLNLVVFVRGSAFEDAGERERLNLLTEAVLCVCGGRYGRDLLWGS